MLAVMHPAAHPLALISRRLLVPADASSRACLADAPRVLRALPVVNRSRLWSTPPLHAAFHAYCRFMRNFLYAQFMRNVVCHARAVPTAVDYASRQVVYARRDGPSDHPEHYISRYP